MSSPGTTHQQPVRGRSSERERSPQAPAEFCDLCGEPNPIDHDAYPPTGLWICVECIEHTLQGATYE